MAILFAAAIASCALSGILVRTDGLHLELIVSIIIIFI
jgi:hypothetical protein